MRHVRRWSEVSGLTLVAREDEVFSMNSLRPQVLVTTKDQEGRLCRCRLVLRRRGPPVGLPWSFNWGSVELVEKVEIEE